ncbi:putative disease resistance protein RGA1 [Prunus yedoensis var. nudiflora]|uniref:Putative disease resistance protein RGA1 n=1 Tax=Prunus yedoensis var. nudiflora TaxID=2094558 RepID=A0A314XSY2_PRUYE|nr:putative disease resistance protein RGA1 [Prunus yedoensis var. nudiflora]
MLRDSARLSELGKLKDLRGQLKIKNLRCEQDMVSELNYDGAILKEKRYLYSLILQWMPIERENSDVEESDVIIKSMEALQPHSSLKELAVDGYIGARFASWFHSLINIVNLRLTDCDRCQHLPPLNHLPLLKRLMLYGLRNLEHISEDMVKDFASDEMMMLAASPSTTFFPSLENLSLSHCPNLKGWWRNETALASASSFPCLSTLYIWNCPNLTSMPLYLNLDKLVLLRSSWKVFPSSFVLSKLKSLEIKSVEDIEYVPEEGIGNLTLLQKLEIEDCPNLVSLPDQGMGRLISLQELRIWDCPKLTSLPEGMGNLTLLQHLEISKCPNLVSLPNQGMGRLISLQSLDISNCPKLASLPEGIGNLTLLEDLLIKGCPNLVSLPNQGMGCHISLQRLYISDCPKLASLPEGIGNLKSLSNLQIGCLPNLASLPEGLRCLISLQELKIWDCPNLASLPEGLCYLASLKRLIIKDCPILKQRCQKETGEDWSKIAHIPYIRIDPQPGPFF